MKEGEERLNAKLAEELGWKNIYENKPGDFRGTIPNVRTFVAARVPAWDADQEAMAKVERWLAEKGYAARYATELVAIASENGVPPEDATARHRCEAAIRTLRAVRGAKSRF